MTSLRLQFLVLFFIFAVVRTAYCQPQILVAYGFGVNVYGNDGFSNGTRDQDEDGFADTSHANITYTAESGDIVATVQSANYFAQATGNAKAKAAFGAIGVSFQGTGEVQPAGFATTNGFVEASFTDTVTLRSPRFSSPHPLIINAPLLLADISQLD